MASGMNVDDQMMLNTDGWSIVVVVGGGDVDAAIQIPVQKLTPIENMALFEIAAPTDSIDAQVAVDGMCVLANGNMVYSLSQRVYFGAAKQLSNVKTER